MITVESYHCWMCPWLNPKPDDPDTNLPLSKLVAHIYMEHPTVEFSRVR